MLFVDHSSANCIWSNGTLRLLSFARGLVAFDSTFLKTSSTLITPPFVGLLDAPRMRVMSIGNIGARSVNGGGTFVTGCHNTFSFILSIRLNQLANGKFCSALKALPWAGFDYMTRGYPHAVMSSRRWTSFWDPDRHLEGPDDHVQGLPIWQEPLWGPLLLWRPNHCHRLV